jgi:hypothetical protein
VPAASGPSGIEAIAGLAVGLGGPVAGVGARLGAGKLGEGEFGDADPSADDRPGVHPVMANKVTTTTTASLGFTAAAADLDALPFS